uniref:Uncharacterized protein n=1 Tax=Triticum urartu TaxID=4572 RepID=A0A8R7UX92_TRIUA
EGGRGDHPDSHGHRWRRGGHPTAPPGIRSPPSNPSSPKSFPPSSSCCCFLSLARSRPLHLADAAVAAHSSNPAATGLPSMCHQVQPLPLRPLHRQVHPVGVGSLCTDPFFYLGTPAAIIRFAAVKPSPTSLTPPLQPRHRGRRRCYRVRLRC